MNLANPVFSMQQNQSVVKV